MTSKHSILASLLTTASTLCGYNALGQNTSEPTLLDSALNTRRLYVEATRYQHTIDSMSHGFFKPLMEPGQLYFAQKIDSLSKAPVEQSSITQIFPVKTATGSDTATFSINSKGVNLGYTHGDVTHTASYLYSRKKSPVPTDVVLGKKVFDGDLIINESQEIVLNEEPGLPLNEIHYFKEFEDLNINNPVRGTSVTAKRWLGENGQPSSVDIHLIGNKVDMLADSNSGVTDELKDKSLPLAEFLKTGAYYSQKAWGLVQSYLTDFSKLIKPSR